MAAAQRRLAAQVVEAEVDAELAYASIEPVTNPFEALAQLTSEVLAMKESLGARVNALTTLRYSAAGSGTEQLRAEVALLERAQDRAGRFLDLLARSGFEERRVRVSEQQGALMVVVLHRIFDRLELSAAQRLLIPVVVPQEFRVAIAAEPHRGQDRAR